MRIFRQLVIVTAVMLVPLVVTAQGMMGTGGGMPNGTGMVTVASDGSLLATQMGMSMLGGPGGGGPNNQRAIVSIGTNGGERWRTIFGNGWPMMVANDGDLVVVVVMNSAWMWRSVSGMGWFPWGTPPQEGGGSEDAVLIGLTLSSGAERWHTTVPGDMASFPQFAPDGSRIYVSVTDFGPGSTMGGGGPMRQGDTGGWGTQMTNKIVALDRNGVILWTRDLAASGMMP